MHMCVENVTVHICEVIHLFNFIYLLSAYYCPYITLGNRDVAVNKAQFFQHGA